MKHDKTFAAIAKLQDVEVELHRLKNALGMANRALDGVLAEKQDLLDVLQKIANTNAMDYEYQAWAKEAIEAKLKEKNT